MLEDERREHLTISKQYQNKLSKAESVHQEEKLHLEYEYREKLDLLSKYEHEKEALEGIEET
jgi:hypothetical protein